MTIRQIRHNMLANRSLMEFDDLKPVVMSYLKEVRERQKELA